MRPPAGVRVVPQRQVGEPRGPGHGGVLPEARLVVLADLAQGADARVHGHGRLLGVGLHGLPPPVPLALALQHAVELRGRHLGHLLEDGVLRGVAYGARGVLPHHGGLVRHALQREVHEAVPVGHGPQAQGVHGPVRDVEGQAPVAVRGLRRQERAHEAHVRLQGHLGELVGARAHQRPGNVGQRQAHGLPSGRAALPLVLVLGVRVGLSLAELHRVVGRAVLILGARDAADELHHDASDVLHTVLGQDARPRFSDHARDADHLGLERVEFVVDLRGVLAGLLALRRVPQGSHDLLQEDRDQLLQAGLGKAPVLDAASGALNHGLPRLEGLLLKGLGQLDVQQGEQVLTGWREELAEGLLQGLDEHSDQIQAIGHLFEDRSLEAQYLVAICHILRQAHVRVLVVRVIGHLGRVHLRRPVLQGLEQDWQQCRHVRLEVLLQRFCNPPG
mmetsp:Transcript_12320/g.34913  ORF Transcript_12320/g.34913 Transcript_12320/m.34913 type:complete len:447 (-) Transcript_12320:1874-3214(-)